MLVTEAVRSRTSVRQFLEAPIPDDVMREIFNAAQMSPSNCNTQPWKTYVVSGEKKKALSAHLLEAVMSGNPPNPDFDWTVDYKGEHRDRQIGAAFSLYNTLGIDREDRQARGVTMLRNWEFFGAPHAVFFTMEKYLGIMGAVDLGIYAQTLALILRENGMGCCFQGALGQYPDPVREVLGLSDDQGVLFGMSIGYPDLNAKINAARTDRENVETAVNFVS
ncbi:nitroreductase [Maricurvus nonylphenolicus]|uniref:nitroreductase family protein n=1 Tax=Maricurvus nonylphenolicus TaxID=1008307 RepID=UPI0036F239B5